jgi:hypothetical protein
MAQTTAASHSYSIASTTVTTAREMDGEVATDELA